jgi:alkylation response protein AidB-like acyl-CoA dehydrogenase
MIGGARVCIDITADYAREREQYGKPIGGYQIIQHYMANMFLAYDTTSNYLYRVTSMIDEAQAFEIDALALKAAANEAFDFIAERSVQIHGGIGTTREANIGLFYRRAKTYESALGGTAHNFEKIADKIISEGLSM